jgi:hypothetical protein
MPTCNYLYWLGQRIALSCLKKQTDRTIILFERFGDTQVILVLLSTGNFQGMYMSYTIDASIFFPSIEAELFIVASSISQVCACMQAAGTNVAGERKDG